MNFQDFLSALKTIDGFVWTIQNGRILGKTEEVNSIVYNPITAICKVLTGRKFSTGAYDLAGGAIAYSDEAVSLDNIIMAINGQHGKVRDLILESLE